MTQNDIVNMHRLFVGFRLPDEVCDSVASLQTGIDDMRWCAPQNLHVTLTFIGDVIEDIVLNIQSTLREVEGQPITLTIQRTGFWEPNIIWAGVEPEGDALFTIKDRTDGMLRAMGLRFNDRPYMPHVTLGHVKGTPDEAVISGYQEHHKAVHIGPFTVPAITLFESIRHSEGVEYRALEHYPMGAR